MLLDLDVKESSSVNAHDAEVALPIAHSSGCTEDGLWEMLATDPLSIETGWPKREMNNPKWLPTTRDRSASVLDIYTHLKPKKIGHVSVLGFVKVNDSWVLHGRISYVGGHFLNHAILKPLNLVVHTKDIVRDDCNSGRVLIEIVKVRTDPL
jgi:hypothetical protein